MRENTFTRISRMGAISDKDNSGDLSISLKAVAMSWNHEGRGLFGFWLRFGSVTGLLVTCAFVEALPKAKNPRGSSLHLFCQCSRTNQPLDAGWGLAGAWRE